MSSTLTKERLLHHTILRENFMAFCEQCFYLLHKQKLMVNYHHRLLASELEECRLATAYNLVINMPPRELKSEITSIFYPIWLLAHSQKQLDILIFTRSKKLGKLFLYHMASLLQEELIEMTFPDLRLDAYYHDRLETTKGRITILSVNSPIIGLGGDVIIIDDPISVAEATDIAKIRDLNKWFSTELLSRLNNKNEAKIILLMQRLHRFDLSAYMLFANKANVRHLSLEAIATKEQTYTWQEWSVLTRKFVSHSYQRNKDSVLNEARDNLANMQKLKEQLGSKVFEAQYQQEPKVLNCEKILCKDGDEYDELAIKEALLCIGLSVENNKAHFLASLQEKNSNRIALIDYKEEVFTNLQATLNSYVEALLQTINSSYPRFQYHHFSNLKVFIMLVQPDYQLDTDELQKFRKESFRYQFRVINDKKFARYYIMLKNALYREAWSEDKSLVINDNTINKEFKQSLENEDIDDFFKVLCLSFLLQHNY